ncbi:hypothetical protein KP509_26G036600 [Ceratopteris richardii]|uniref:APO domain-containing protein n=1 Tax=Ceratopteris richardii TaxID=49495 RepID=A0A8T2RLA4_CERRI|nr:hypothetical protein KP509_26G036600 [Ceratopteris richardii]KAH7296731.1 hypothetical protein KP509_26G036600 [Ceratopteris richardii]
MAVCYDAGLFDPSLSLFSKVSSAKFKNESSSLSVSRGGLHPVVRKLKASSSTYNSQIQNKDLPRVIPRNKKKPFVAPPRRLPKRGIKKPRLEDPYSSPGDGLLVQEMIPLAYTVFEAREALLKLVPILMEVVPVKACRFCEQSHVGPIGHDIATCEGQGSSSRYKRHVWVSGDLDDVIPNLEALHSYDRSNIIRHKSMSACRRLSAVVELCIQAGVDLPDYPVLRRTKPLWFTDRKSNIGDLYSELLPDSDSDEGLYDYSFSSRAASHYARSSTANKSGSEPEFEGNKWRNDVDWISEEIIKDKQGEKHTKSFEGTKEIADSALRLWEIMRAGAAELMTRYTVRVCGYCPQVHIGPRGHLIRECQGFKHQWRQGIHGWQMAALDDLIPPNYVWHVQDLEKPLLLNELRSFYGQAPAIVELCVQAGGEVPEKYRPMMRLDVVAPTSYESRNAV